MIQSKCGHPAQISILYLVFLALETMDNSQRYSEVNLHSDEYSAVHLWNGWNNDDFLKKKILSSHSSLHKPEDQ